MLKQQMKQVNRQDIDKKGGVFLIIFANNV